MSERHEYYKRRGATYGVTTCQCCNYGGIRDAWSQSNEYRKDYGTDLIACGVSRGYTDQMVLITEAEARKRAPKLVRVCTGEE